MTGTTAEVALNTGAAEAGTHHTEHVEQSRDMIGGTCINVA